MYTQGSVEFNQIIETPNNKAIKSRLVLLDDNTIIDKIKSLILYSASCSQELQIGTTNMAYIDAEVESNLILTNREVRLECGVELSDGTVEYIPMGVFTIQKPQGDIDFVKFTANDRMQKFDYPYSSTLTYPTTDKAMLEELATMCGVTLATNIDNPITIDKALDGYTRREVLGYIAGLHGKFACFNRNGELELKWYNTDSPITKNIGLIWGFEKSDEDFTVSKIEVAKNNETTLTSGNGYGVVQHSNPLATQEIVNDLFTSLNGFTYNASVVDILDDIRLDLGDVIKVTYLDGKDYLAPCMSLKQDFGQGSTNIESFAKSDTENTYRFTGPTVQYLNRMAIELLVANRVIATKVDAEYVQSHAITTDNLDAITANITNLVVDEIDGKYATIDFANIDVAHINKTNIGLLFAEVGLIDRATIVEGHITGFLDAVEVNANKITAGTLIADRILLSGGENGVLYALNNLGELTSTNVDTLDGYVLTDRTINADKIIANSITANEIDVEDVFAQDITATGTIRGAKLIGADAEISSGSIGGFDIKNTFLGFKESSNYLDINTNEEKMSHWYSFKIQPHSYNDVSASSTKVFWIGANPIINGDGVGEDSFYDETKLFYPLYITADGTINSEGKDTSIIFGSGHNYGLNTVNWAWSDASSIVFGKESIEVKAGRISLNKLLDFTGKGFEYDGTELLAFNDSGIYSPKVSTEKLSAKESVSTDELYAYSSTIGYGGMLSNGKVTVLGDIETKTTSSGTTANIICGGKLVAEQGMYVHDTDFNNWGTAGYIVLARIEVLDGNLTDSGYDIGVVGIGGYKGEIKIRFANTANITDTEVEEFSKTGSLPEIYYTFTKGTNSVTVDIIVYKQEYQMFRITHLNYTNLIWYKTIITYPNTYESTLRAGAVQATIGTNYLGYVRAIGNAWFQDDVVAHHGTPLQVALSELLVMVGRGETQVEDANNVKETSFLITISSSLNVPDKNGFLLTFKTHLGNCILQVNTSYSATDLYFRTCWYGVWQGWRWLPTQG